MSKNNRFRMKKMKIIAQVAACSALVLGACDAKASLITVTWSGTITVSPNSIAISIAVGDKISGSFTYDDASDVAQTGSSFTLFDTRHWSTFSINGLVGSLSNQQIAVWNDSSLGDDLFQSREPSTLPGSTYVGDMFGTYTPTVLNVNLSDSTASAISASNPLPSSLNPMDFDNLLASELFLESGNAFRAAYFKVDTFSFNNNVVPEPATISIWALGAIGMAGYGWRRKRNAS